MVALPTAHGRAWYAGLGAEKLRLACEEDLYETLVQRVNSGVRTKEHAVVDKDIGRTFPERAEFQSSAARTRLRRVLSAYALRHTYCQGMSYIAALMLQHMPERDAFWATAALVEKFLPSGYFTDDLHGAYMDQHIAFATFLPHLLPQLARHLELLEFPLTLIGVRWFLCLFAADMEPDCTARLWDLLFAHGAHVLFALALGLLAQHEERLLAAPDVPELFTTVRTIGRVAPSFSELRSLTMSGFPTEADVQVARAAYQRQHAPPSSAPAATSEDEHRAAPAAPPVSSAPPAPAAPPAPPAPPANISAPEVAAEAVTADVASDDQSAHPLPATAPAAAPAAAVAHSSPSDAAAAPSASEPASAKHTQSGEAHGDADSEADVAGGGGGVADGSSSAHAARMRASEAIAAAMDEVTARREASASLEAERHSAREAVRTHAELCDMLGGEERLRALREHFDPVSARPHAADASASGGGSTGSYWWSSAVQLLSALSRRPFGRRLQ